MIKRAIADSILKALDRHKAVSILGARQVGKSTLTRQLFEAEDNVLFLDGDEPDMRAELRDATSTSLKALFGKAKTVVIDEAQKIPGIGNTLKLITDKLPDIRLVVTGSSSLILSQEINESLTGRKREFRLFPLSFGELVSDTDQITEKRLLNQRLRYGSYPEVITSPGDEKEVLGEILNSYLYKDVLPMGGISKPDKMEDLVRALAFQTGAQVSYNELSKLVGVDVKTIDKYLDVLEKCFIIFRLPSYARNFRNELKFDKKIYFWDLGIRNAVIGNFTPLESRGPEETERMWESYLMAERMKKLEYGRSFAKSYFWRTVDRKEIDLIEDSDGKLSAYEFKWSCDGNARCPKKFAEGYPEAAFRVVNRSDYQDFLL